MARISLQPRRHHKNLIFFFLGLALAVGLYQTGEIQQLTLFLGKFGYLSAFLAGMLFVSTFTVGTGALILLALAQSLSPIGLIVVAGLGAVTVDLVIFRFVKDTVVDEITPIYEKLTGSHLKKIMHTKYFGWTLPVVGALVIASPLPDELGVSLMGVSNMKMPQFLLISLASHSIGMFLVVSASLMA